jgi:hypothetical protein
LIDGATDFARRQPAAFLGLSVLAGFSVIRFLKASGGQTSTGGHTSRSEGFKQTPESWPDTSPGAAFENRQDFSQR